MTQAMTSLKSFVDRLPWWLWGHQ